MDPTGNQSKKRPAVDDPRLGEKVSATSVESDMNEVDDIDARLQRHAEKIKRLRARKASLLQGVTQPEEQPQQQNSDLQAQKNAKDSTIPPVQGDNQAARNRDKHQLQNPEVQLWLVHRH